MYPENVVQFMAMLFISKCRLNHCIYKRRGFKAKHMHAVSKKNGHHTRRVVATMSPIPESDPPDSEHDNESDHVLVDVDLHDGSDAVQPPVGLGVRLLRQGQDLLSHLQRVLELCVVCVDHTLDHTPVLMFNVLLIVLCVIAIMLLLKWI